MENANLIIDGKGGYESDCDIPLSGVTVHVFAFHRVLHLCFSLGTSLGDTFNGIPLAGYSVTIDFNPDCWQYFIFKPREPHREGGVGWVADIQWTDFLHEWVVVVLFRTAVSN